MDFSDQFRKVIICYKRIGYNINVMPLSLIATGCHSSDSMMGPKLVELFKLVRAGLSLLCCLVDRSSTVFFFFFAQGFQWCCFTF